MTVPILKTVKDSLRRSVNFVLMELSKTTMMTAAAAIPFSSDALFGPCILMRPIDPIDSAMTMLWIAIDEGFTATM